MRRGVLLWAAVVLVASGAGTPAAAQQASSDKWDVTVAPYFMGAAMSGTTAVRGREVDVDVSASDIFSNLQFGAMGLVVARKVTWQIFPTVGFKFTDHFSLEVGYRWLDLDYETGDGNERFAYDVLTQGPVGGLAFRF